MKKIIKSVLLSVVILTAALLLFSCAGEDHYGEYDKEGYTISVKYDANGGSFTTNVSTIVDAYKLSDLPVEGDKAVLALMSPDDSRRGKENAFTVTNAGYFLAGWYQNKTPVTNENGEELDEDGNVASASGKAVAYTYSERWDFDKTTKELDKNAEYSSKEPTVTLYAVWLPRFEFEFYDMEGNKLDGGYDFDPNYVKGIECPEWNKKGKLDMKKLPEKDGMTLKAIYADMDKKEMLADLTIDPTASADDALDIIEHTCEYDLDTATVKNGTMKLYLDFIEGEWFKISTAEQFLSSASANGNYEIVADLDFENKWSSLLMNNFSGYIDGNGYTFKNILVEPYEMDRMSNGMFGTVKSGATIKDIKFENLSVFIDYGTRKSGTAFGLFAGTVESGANVSGLSFKDCKLEITANALYDVEGQDISTGLFSGRFIPDGVNVDTSGITCVREGYEVTVNSDKNSVTFTATEDTDTDPGANPDTEENSDSDIN